MDRLAIEGGWVVTMEGREGIYPGGSVVVEEGRILYAGPKEGAPPAQRRIDAAGCAVTPGMVNAHAHAAMTLFRGYADDMRLMEWLTTRIFPAEEKLTGEDVYWGTALACAEMLRAGVTTFCDMYFFMLDAARAAEETGIRAVLTRGLVGDAASIGSRLAEARELHRQYHGRANGRLTTALGPHSPYLCTPDALELVAAEAARLGVAVHIHLSETYEEVEECRRKHGCTPIGMMVKTGLDKLHLICAHCVGATPEDIEILAGNPGGVAHCPVSNLKLACGVAPVTAMRRAGVNVGLGTDGPGSSNTMALHESVRLAAWLQKNAAYNPLAITAYDALELSTLGGARVLGLEGEVGSLAAGKKADVVVTDLSRTHALPVHDPLSALCYAARAEDVRTVLVDGRLVVQDGRLLTADEAEIAACAAEAAQALLARA